MRSMVEGHRRPIKRSEVVSRRTCPSTPDFVGGPPPRAGEDLGRADGHRASSINSRIVRTACSSPTNTASPTR